MSKKIHPLSVYLIKDSETFEESMVVQDLRKKDLGKNRSFYFKGSFTKQPPWLKFFENLNFEEIFSSSASALLLIKVEDRYFAIAFGPGGRHFLKKGVWEERFGLVVTLNSVKKDSLRSIDTKTLEADGIQTRVQSARPVATDNFGIDVEKDLVRSVTGIPKDENEFGKTLSGKDALRVCVNCNVDSVDGFLKKILIQYKKDEYKSDFPWIDQLREINDPSHLEKLEEILLRRINEEDPQNLWLTVPEILDWEDHGGFKYSAGRKDELLDDIHIQTFKEFVDHSPLLIEDLKKNGIFRFSKTNEYQKNHWSVYECLYFECASESETFFLTGGKWFSVGINLVKTVKEYFQSIPQDSGKIDFIDYNHDSENDYNIALAEHNDAFCVDSDLIKIEGRSTFEFCDVYTRKKQMVHVKKYARSSALSHLFNQGFVSANFLLDPDFRKQINKKFPLDFKITDVSARPNMDFGEYAVVFGIISKVDTPLEIPFFSKLSLMHVAKDLRNLGFEIKLVKIKNLRPDRIVRD